MYVCKSYLLRVVRGGLLFCPNKQTCGGGRAGGGVVCVRLRVCCLVLLIVSVCDDRDRGGRSQLLVQGIPDCESVHRGPHETVPSTSAVALV